MQFFGDIAFTTLALMVFAALCAGFIDAIAGGGGLIQLLVVLQVQLDLQVQME